MKKKIKDLTFDDVYNICKKYHYTSCKETGKSACNQCPIKDTICCNDYDEYDDFISYMLECANYNRPFNLLEKEIEVEQ